MSEANKEVFRKLFQQFFNNRDLDSVGEFLTPDFLNHASLYEPLVGIDVFVGIVKTYFSAFPDIHYTVDDLMAVGDRVIGRVTSQGTHKAEFLGFAPTGKRFSIMQVRVARFVDGKIAEHWGLQDTIGMLDQLGLVPAMKVPRF